MVRRFIGCVVAVIALSASLFACEEEPTITPQCEVALTESARIAMIFATTGLGYRAMIVADNAAEKVCDG